MEEPLNCTGVLAVSPRTIADSSTLGRDVSAVVPSAASTAGAVRVCAGNLPIENPEDMKNTIKKTPKKGRDGFSFSPPKLKLTINSSN